MKAEWLNLFAFESVTETHTDQKILEARTILLKIYRPLITEIIDKIGELNDESKKNTQKYDLSSEVDSQRIIDFLSWHFFSKWRIEFFIAEKRPDDLVIDFRAIKNYESIRLINQAAYIKEIEMGYYDDIAIAQEDRRYPVFQMFQLDLKISTKELIKEFEKKIIRLKSERKIDEAKIKDEGEVVILERYKTSKNDFDLLWNYLEKKMTFEEIEDVTPRVRELSDKNKEGVRAEVISKRVKNILNFINSFNEAYKKMSQKDKDILHGRNRRSRAVVKVKV